MTDAAYRATTYRVFVPGAEPIDLRIGERSAALERLLDTCASATWAFITAWNPGSRPLPAVENEARQAELLRAVGERGWRALDGVGIPADGRWQAEASVLVLGISREEAVALGRRYGQSAVVAGQRGGAAELVYCGS